MKSGEDLVFCLWEDEIHEDSEHCIRQESCCVRTFLSCTVTLVAVKGTQLHLASLAGSRLHRIALSLRTDPEAPFPPRAAGGPDELSAVSVFARGDHSSLSSLPPLCITPTCWPWVPLPLLSVSSRSRLLLVHLQPSYPSTACHGCPFSPDDAVPLAVLV